jgi:hypothetical protein
MGGDHQEVARRRQRVITVDLRRRHHRRPRHAEGREQAIADLAAQ